MSQVVKMTDGKKPIHITKGVEYEFLTVKEAADYLKISEYTIREMCRNNEIPHIRLGGKKYHFCKATLTEWVLSKQVMPQGA